MLSTEISEPEKLNTSKELNLNRGKEIFIQLAKQSKQTEKLRELRTKGDIYGIQYKALNKSSETLNRSNRTDRLEKSHEKPEKQLHQSLLIKNSQIDSGIDEYDKYKAHSDYKNKKREIEDISSLRVESEPSAYTENTIEKEIQIFLEKFDTKETKLVAKQWLKKIIDGENTEKKSLELYLQREKESFKQMKNNSLNTPQKISENPIEKKDTTSQIYSPSHAKKMKNTDASTRPAWNYSRKKDASITKSGAQLKSPLGKSASQKCLGSGAKLKKEIDNKKEIKSYNAVPDQNEMKSAEIEVNSASGFKRKKIDSNSNSAMSEDEMKKLSDRLNNPMNVNLARNLEYLEFLRKDVVRSINYIEKSIQDLSSVSAESETSLEARSV